MYFVPFAPTDPLPVKSLRPPVDDKVFEIVTFPENAEVFIFPDASLNELFATVITPVPLDDVYGV
jgi:hypothetical protein